jgi:hypothetical protein
LRSMENLFRKITAMKTGPYSSSKVSLPQGEQEAGITSA